MAQNKGILMKRLRLRLIAAGALLATTVSACVIIDADTAAPQPAVEISAEKFEADRQAILAMAGNFTVTFDFTETTAFVDGYELKEPKLSGAREVVRVIEDRGDFISLQHILVVGPPNNPMPIKHWRQDWTYQPDGVLTFIGGNAWETRDVATTAAAGRWSQVVYQVDDAPRYGALAAWTHQDGVSQWEPDAAWRPLPRRDATTRDDYHAINAVNRHAITPTGWVHEQDNSKLVLSGDDPQVLVREVGVNTYTRNDDFPSSVADVYWEATHDYWAAVRAEWSQLEASTNGFGLTIQGEPEELYMKLLTLADAVKSGDTASSDAIDDAKDVIASYTTARVGRLETRLAALQP